MGKNRKPTDEELRSFCRRLPKVDLHAHLNGSIRPSTLVALARDRGVALPALLRDGTTSRGADDGADGDGEATFLNTKPRSLAQCFDIFAIIPACVDDLAALRRIAREALEDAAADGVAYLEVRTGPKALLRDRRAARARRCTKGEYVAAVVEVMGQFQREERLRYQREMEEFEWEERRWEVEIEERHQEKTGESCDSTMLEMLATRYGMAPLGLPPRLPLVPRLIISVDRAGTLDQARENIDLAIDLFESGQRTIVGVELGGNPTRNDFRTFEPVFAKARKAGLPVSIHCGEVPAGENLPHEAPALRRAYDEAVAVLRFRPDRLGHALLLPGPLLDGLSADPIPIECCPTSNVMTLELAARRGGDLLDGVRRHPRLGGWLREGYPISINTDDSGLFGTNMTREWLLVARAFALNPRDVGEMVLRGAEHAFDPWGETKRWMRANLTPRINLLI